MNKQKPLHKRKLWVLLRSLTDQERKKLESYISCELGETHPDAVKLFKNFEGKSLKPVFSMYLIKIHELLLHKYVYNRLSH